MHRNIDHLFGLDTFLGWKAKHSYPSAASLPYLWRLYGDPVPVRLSRDEQKAFKDHVDAILAVPSSELGAQVLAFNFLSGDGRIAKKLLSPYDESFLARFFAGLLAIEDDFDGFFGPSTVGVFADRKLDYFRYLATGQDNTYPGSAELNEAVVHILTDPDRMMSLPELDSYVRASGGSVALWTENLVSAFKNVVRLRDALDAPNQLAAKNPGLSPIEAYALILALRTNLNVNQKEMPLHLSLESMLDLYYGQADKQDIQDWLTFCFERANIEPGTVHKIGPYPDDLNLNYQRSENLASEESRMGVLQFLSKRFAILFEIGSILLKVMELYTMRIDFEHFSEPSKWAGTARIIILTNRINALYIMEALDMSSNLRLYFRDPTVERYSASGKVPFLQPVEHSDEASRQVVRDVFFEQVALRSLNDSHSSPYFSPSFRVAGQSACILRTKDEMMSQLDSLAPSAKDSIKGLDFHSYLESMGYPDMNQPANEYLGYEGLRKAVQIHSLAHLDINILSKLQEPWPLFSPELIAPRQSR